MDCTVARAFWWKVKVFTGVKLPDLHPLTWARDIIDPKVCVPKDASVILCGMWSVWMSRNRRRHGEEEIPVRAAVWWAIDTAFDPLAIASSSQEPGSSGEQPAVLASSGIWVDQM